MCNKKILFCLSGLFIFQVNVLIPSYNLFAQNNSDVKTRINPGVISYSPEPVQQLRITFDYYHHTLPSTKVGNYMVTGSWVDDKGRYGWDDFVHSNTFDPVYTALGNDYRIFMSREPYSPKMLSQTDAVVLINADNPEIVPEAKRISDDEILYLQKFVKDGGSLMVMVNAGSSARASEGFEKVQLGKLVRGFGLDWNDVDTHYSDNLIPEGHSHFYDVPNFHYGAGCTLEILPEASKPEVLLDVYSDPSYTDREVKGHGIIMVRPGKGKFILVGDVGSWTGNIARPWADNVTILKQLFMYMKPDNGVRSARFTEGTSLNYEVTISGLQAVPVANNLSGIKRPHYKFFSPRLQTNMPYFERSANLQLTIKERTDKQASRIEARITDFKWFDEKSQIEGDQLITFTASRQGKVSGIETLGYDAQWFAPDLPVVIALLPVDGVRPGDSWKSVESLRIPVIRGSDLPPVKQYDMDIVYVRDTEIDGKKCRLLRSTAEIWLDDLNVKVEELLPIELVHRIGGSHYQYYKEHGGKLLFKREQWVDDQGIVIRARTQTRVIAWIQDTRRPIAAKNADKDNEMIVSLAHIVNFNLK